LWPLVEQHGPAAVQTAGEQTLGYPAQWAATGKEIKAIRDRLAEPF
jgi:hypothetical protein